MLIALATEVPSHGRGRRFNPYSAHHFTGVCSAPAGTNRNNSAPGVVDSSSTLFSVRSRTSADNGIYIVHADSGRIKVGLSRNIANRLVSLRNATHHKLELVFFGVFGDRSREIEGGAHKLLKPFAVRGEWFNVCPFIAGIAIEAVRDDCERHREFLSRWAEAFATRHDVAEEIKLDRQIERDFPDLYSRVHLPRNFTIGLGGREIPLPPTKFTRLIVEGFPEITWGAPTPPSHYGTTTTRRRVIR